LASVLLVLQLYALAMAFNFGRLGSSGNAGTNKHNVVKCTFYVACSFAKYVRVPPYFWNRLYLNVSNVQIYIHSALYFTWCNFSYLACYRSKRAVNWKFFLEIWKCFSGYFGILLYLFKN